MIRVMILTNSQSGGGAERSMNLVARELTILGYKVYVVSINLGVIDSVEPNFKLIQLERNWKDGYLATIRSLGTFRKNLRKINPQVLIVNCELPELYASLISCKCKIIVVEHTSRPWNGRRQLGFVVRFILKIKKCSWVKVSENIGNWPFDFKGCKVIPNPLRSENTMVLKENKIEKLINLCFVGRLSQEKNPELFLRLCRNLKLSGKIIGEGILRESLEKDSNSNNLSVDFKGYLSDPWNKIQKGDLLIIPSVFEGDGLVAVEAIQLGVPLLVSDNSDFRRFNLPEQNYCKDEEAFQERIRLYSDDISKLQINKSIANRILKERDINAVVNSWSSLIENLAG